MRQEGNGLPIVIVDVPRSSTNEVATPRGHTLTVHIHMQ